MISVSVIEDAASYRSVLELLLSSSPGFHCSGVFEYAEQALTHVPMLKPMVCLVDIQLPGMNGIELVRCLRELCPQTLFMMCTAHDEDDEVFQALEAGAHGYIVKSISPQKLLDAILDLYNGGSPMSNEIARKVVMRFQKSLPKPVDFELTKREKEILECLSRGMLYKEIAVKLFISIDTVKRHCFNIYTKLHVSNKTEAINKYFQNGIR